MVMPVFGFEGAPRGTPGTGEVRFTDTSTCSQKLRPEKLTPEKLTRETLTRVAALILDVLASGGQLDGQTFAGFFGFLQPLASLG